MPTALGKETEQRDNRGRLDNEDKGGEGPLALVVPFVAYLPRRTLVGLANAEVFR